MRQSPIRRDTSHQVFPYLPYHSGHQHISHLHSRLRQHLPLLLCLTYLVHNSCHLVALAHSLAHPYPFTNHVLHMHHRRHHTAPILSPIPFKMPIGTHHRLHVLCHYTIKSWGVPSGTDPTHLPHHHVTPYHGTSNSACHPSLRISTHP